MNIKHPKENMCRMNFNANLYQNICEQDLSTRLETIERLRAEKDEYNRQELSREVDSLGVKVIIFASLSIESAINHYAGWQLGDSYFESHISRLDVISKWVIVPRLVCNQSLDKGSASFSALKKLIRARNVLVHNKSRTVEATELTNPIFHEKLKKKESDYEEDVLNAFRAVVLLSLSMDNLVGSQFNPLRSFDKKTSVTHELPKNLQSMVNECKNILGKKT